MPCPELLRNDSRSCCWGRQSWAHAETRWSIVLSASTAFDIQSTAPAKVTHRPVVSSSVSWWNFYINLHYLPCTVSKVLLQPTGASWMPVRSLSVPIIGCAVGVEIGDASPWRFGLQLDKRSGRWSFRFSTQGLIGGCTVADARIVKYVSVLVSVSKLTYPGVRWGVEIWDASPWRC